MSNRKRDTKKQQTPAKFSNDKLQNRYTPKTENHTKYFESIINNTITFAYGPSGVGKTAMALCIMCEHLVENKIDKLIITKPFVESSPKGLGFLKGDLESKLEPYLAYLIEYLKFFLGEAQYLTMVNLGRIEVLPLEYMRGSTYKHSYIFGDELQNGTAEQCKLLVTRLGEGSKCILCGDPMQTDLNGKFKSGFGDMICKLEGLEGVGIIGFDKSDIMRHGLLGKILDRLEK